MPSIGFWEILIVVLLVIVLFGAKKLPDAARSIGRSMRIFKSEVKEMGSDNKDEHPEDTEQQAQLPQGQSSQGSTAASDLQDQLRNQPDPQQNLQQGNPQQGNPQQNISQSNN